MSTSDLNLVRRFLSIFPLGFIESSNFSARFAEFFILKNLSIQKYLLDNSSSLLPDFFLLFENLDIFLEKGLLYPVDDPLGKCSNEHAKIING